MKKKHKITLLVIGILLVLSLMLSSSYALWVFNVSQESTNVMVSDCFEITFTDNNPIGLSSSFPMRDSDGVQTTPYAFTIKNICNHPADFQINLETLNTSTIDEEFIKADLNGHITEYNVADSVEPTIDDAKSAAMLYEDTLAVNGEKTYNLRIWVNENATQEDVENKSYASKISVIATVRKQFAEGTIIDGPTFSKILKELSGDTDASNVSNNESIISVQRSFNEPVAADNAVNIAAEGTNTPIYAWFKDGTIYIYSSLDKIYLNPDSSYMFRAMTNLTSLDVSYFDSSNVTNMGKMFSLLNHLTKLDVSHFNTSKVTSMSSMFYGMSSLTTLDVSNFDTSKVTTMTSMFRAMTNLTSLNLSHFDTSKVLNMSYMFSGMSSLTSLDVSHFNTSKVTDMSYMFSGMSSLTSLDVSNFDTSKVTNMSNMLYNVTNLTSLDVSYFNTSKVTNMSSMFMNMGKLSTLDVSGFDTSNVTKMQNIFRGLRSIENIQVNNFNTSKVTDMSFMFYDMKGLTTLDVSNFDTSNVENISSMFREMDNITSIYVGDNWNTSNVTLSTSMFTLSKKIVGGAGTTYDENHKDAEYARVDDPANGKPGYFTYKSA